MISTFTLGCRCSMRELICYLSSLEAAEAFRAPCRFQVDSSRMEIGGGTKGTLALLVVLVVVAGRAGSVAGQGCPSTFFAALVQLVPCRPAVTPFSPVVPSEACCNAVKALGQPCLCVLVNGPPISGVDRNMARGLPAKCAINFGPCGPGL